MNIKITNCSYKLPNQARKWFVQYSKAYIECQRDIELMGLKLNVKDQIQVIEKDYIF